MLNSIPTYWNIVKIYQSRCPLIIIFHYFQSEIEGCMDAFGDDDDDFGDDFDTDALQVWDNY